MGLSKNIKTLRGNELKTQEELADYMNVTRQTISKWENGASEPAVLDLVRIAGFFKISLDELILGNIEANNYNISSSQLLLSNGKGLTDSIGVMRDEEVEDVFFPSVSPNDLVGFESFNKAYYMNMQVDKTKDKSNIIEVLHLYEDAFENGIVEAGANILRIIVRTIMAAKASDLRKPLMLQDKLERYMEALEEMEHPAGSFYRAFVLIYGLRITDKTEDENFDNGLILMYEIANEGNELAMRYVDYIESAEEEDVD